MTKRPNPFNDYFPMQQKIHVGEKEVNKGVAMENRMKIVYERTRSLLYNGIRNQDPVQKINGIKYHVAAEDFDSTELTTCRSSSSRNHYKQLCINGCCNKLHKNSKTNLVESCCMSCSRPSDSKAKCSFCEKLVCNECLRRCHYCCNDFCPLCSYKQYNLKDESAVCLSCSM